MTGQTIAHFRILEKLGEGGMGVVHRAEDTRLDRTVALKFLAAHLLESEEHKQRFLREAKAAAALDHPNICTVHEVGEADGQVFLAMGFVDGSEVRAKIRERPLKLEEALDVAIQAAEGLRAAHEKGIVHRDIKSSNLMLTSTGQVKLMDFGLAQLSDGIRITKTEVVLGTPAYMSPEQAQRQPTDRRTDIWSLGVVLYEMVTGRLPFEGDKIHAVLHSIIAEPHEPMTALRAGVPLELDRIVGKALQKKPEHRYQHIDDMLVDLRSVHRKTGATLPDKRPQRWSWVIASIGLLLSAALVLTRTRLTQAPPPRQEYIQLTSFVDSATSPALSADGRMLTFIRGNETFSGRGEIYVKALPDGEPVQLTHDGVNKISPVFLPSGDRIAYGVTGGMGSASSWATYTVPVFGGEPSLLLSNTSALYWIPRLTPPRVLFSEWGEQGAHMRVITSAEDRSSARTAYAPASPYAMAHRAYLSPDRKHLLVAEMEGGWTCKLAPFEGGSQAKQVGPVPSQCTSAAWSPDGAWMYFSANVGNGYHIWRQRFPDGTPEQVTFGATEEEGIAFAPDGRSFVSSVGVRQTTLWVRDQQGERQITSEGYASLPQFSADGKRLYYLLRSKANRRFVSGELWTVSLESGKRDRLLPNFLMEHYSVSRDGKRVVFAAIGDDGHSPPWLAEFDGSRAPRRLSSLDATRVFFGSSGEVYFLGAESETRKFVYRVREDGGGLEKAITEPMAYFYDVSPDAKLLAVLRGRTDVVAYPVGGGSPTSLCGICGAAGGENRGITPPAVSWSPDSKFLYANLRERQQILAIPLRPGHNLPALPPAGIRSFEEIPALGGKVIPEERAYIGPNPSIYAMPRVTTHRNIYRIPVP